MRSLALLLSFTLVVLSARVSLGAAMRSPRVPVQPASVVMGVGAGKSTARVPWVSPAHWSRAVSRICAHALLFEGRHRIGTLAGAIAVSRDIRASTGRRLAKVARLRTPSDRREIDRWLVLERRLAAAYATSYLKIYQVIAAVRTPRQRAREPRLLGKLLHAPDHINWPATRLEALLHVPDCTGGTPRLQPSPAA